MITWCSRPTELPRPSVQAGSHRGSQGLSAARSRGDRLIERQFGIRFSKDERVDLIHHLDGHGLHTGERFVFEPAALAWYKGRYQASRLLSAEMTDLTETIAFVTGAARGIGRGLALDLASRGAQVAVFDIDVENLLGTAAAISHAGGRAVAKQVDVRDGRAVSEAFGSAADELGGLDLLVANAGAISYRRIMDLDADEWRRIIDVNATGVFLSVKSAARLMVSTGHGGSIVAIASVAGKEGEVGLGHYCASKFAVIGLVQSLAKEIAEHDITVNAVCPGTVMTSMIDDLAAAAGDDPASFVERQLIPRPQLPGEIADTVVFLHRSRSITGQALNVDGGTVFH